MSCKKVEPIDKQLSTWHQDLLALLSGILLSLSFLDAQYYIFAWFAYLPLLIAINKASLLRSYCLGLVSGLAFAISAGYWVVDFLMLSKGYGLSLSILWSCIFWFYCAQLSALTALGFQYLKQRSAVHEFILFPLIVVTLYAVFPMLFTVHLGESQSQFLSAIQAIEFTGVYGLDAIIALSNIILFSLVNGLCIRQEKPMSWLFLLAVVPIAVWFIYGMVAMQKWDTQIEQSNTIRIGIVQPNEAPSLEKSAAYPGYSRAYPPEIEMTERLSKAGAELVIWPEAKYKAYLDRQYVAKAYQHQLKELKIRLIFQDIEHMQAAKLAATTLQYNTAVMINEMGQELGRYQKMKRIPFGEYVPFVSGIPLFRTWVEGFFGKFLNEMEGGKTHQIFKDKKINIIPLICYEVMFPEFVAEAVSYSSSDSELGSLLVGLSSNGWFGVTRQPFQHVNASILRAVENRIPLVHAVNNGPSIVALPTGEVIFRSDFHRAGGYLVDVPDSGSSRGSYYSQHPKQFIFSVYAMLVLVIILAFVSKKQLSLKL